MQPQTTAGIHHVTAICGDAQQNLDFYSGILGLRLVKWTVNFDDPASYHLYYGDQLGRPGTILTFFAWPNAPQARHGSRSAIATSFAVPPNALDSWKKRLDEREIEWTISPERFGEQAIAFFDPDGLKLEIVASQSAAIGNPWMGGTVPMEAAIRGLHGVTLAIEGFEHTAQLLAETMGFKSAGEPSRTEPNRFRFQHGTGVGAIVDVCCLPDAQRATTGRGGVHHVAFRAHDDTAQMRWRTELARLGFNVSPVMDRQYFHSIYFKEPGGVLFEIATDNPGFATDEPAEKLGQKLQLPPHLEACRAQIEKLGAPLEVPK